MDSQDYSLLDCGDGAKLERFGEIVLQRPAPQCLWARRDPQAWQSARACYLRSSEGGGEWQERAPLPQEWWIDCAGLRLRLSATGFGHIGVFPEQFPFWDYLRAECGSGEPGPRVLNLFAYTGGASIAAAQGGARVTHCDGSKGIVQWASQNAAANGYADRETASASGGRIRWIIDDAGRFVARELRRKRQYEGIILDPPSFGRGPKGQVWKLERDLQAHLSQLVRLISETPRFLLVSAHTPGVDPLSLQNLLEASFVAAARASSLERGHLACGSMTIRETEGGRQLPSGTWAIWSRSGALPKAPSLREPA
ncbi:MAG TPA: class I SAM-dependent methyltransferase [Candidatus Krumholzibacteria bacterium]|nr:class I SAM-dependent methyltransferase [Candidatus Krumholzibacteria bacterium]